MYVAGEKFKAIGSPQLQLNFVKHTRAADVTKKRWAYALAARNDARKAYAFDSTKHSPDFDPHCLIRVFKHDAQGTQGHARSRCTDEHSSSLYRLEVIHIQPAMYS